MAYGIKYNFNFSNELDEVYYLTFEFLNYTGGQQNINVAVDSFQLRSVGGDEDKLFPILGTECLINILVGRTIDNKGIETDDSTLTIFDLIAAHDNDIRVTIVKVQPNYLQPVYQGFVVVEDNVQPFQDPPFILQVRALDGLGLLKNVDMVDNDGTLFSGNLSVEDWIGNILMKTGLALNLRTYLLPIGIDGDVGNPLQKVFLNASTWRTGELIATTDPSIDVFASEANDAYTALEAICRCFRCRLFQHDGVWNLISLYTYVDPNGWSYFESQSVLTSGVYNQVQTAVSNNLNLTIPVGKEDIIHPVENDQQISLKLGTKWIKLNYIYDQSVNKICNQNFKQGNPNATFDGTISSTIEDAAILPVVTFVTKGYDAFCWTLAGGTLVTGGLIGTVPYPETAQTSDIYIRSVLDIYGTEENRYLVIGHSTGVVSHARSTKFLIDQGDNLEVSFDFRTRIDMSPTNLIPMWILMDGDDGNKYGYGGASALGPRGLLDANYQIGGSIPYPPPVIQTYTGGAGGTTTQWVNISISLNADGGLMQAPVSGSVFIILTGQRAAPYPPVTFTDGVESWFKNIQITIHPYLSGSFLQLKGDYNFSSSAETIKQTKSESIEISDSPKRYFKGALVKSKGDLVAPTWHRKGVIETGRFAQLMERIIFNNLYRQYQKIEGSFRGQTYTLPDFTVKPSGYLNSYTFIQHPVPTKRFILTSFDRNYGTGKGRHVFVEILEDQNADPFVNPETYVFQYIYQ